MKDSWCWSHGNGPSFYLPFSSLAFNFLNILKGIIIIRNKDKEKRVGKEHQRNKQEGCKHNGIK